MQTDQHWTPNSKWSSFVPRRYKHNSVNCLLDRAYKICSSYESICSKVDNIKVILGRNGHPAYFLDSCVRRFFNRKYDKMLSYHEESKNCPPWSKSRHGTELFHELLSIDTTWNIGHNFRLKEKQKILMKHGVVYRLTCSCGSSSIGQTSAILSSDLRSIPIRIIPRCADTKGTILTIKWTLLNRTFLAVLVILHFYHFLNHFLFISMSHGLKSTLNLLHFIV